jgi:hypothetical protein
MYRFYKYNDKRSTTAGDLWLMGLNSWTNPGYSIGTSVIGSCLNIANNGNITIPASLSVGASITATGDITAANLYTKYETNTLFNNKANTSETYTMTDTNDLLNNKLNNKTGAVSVIIKNNNNENVAVFHSDKNVDLKGNVIVSNNLSVNGTSLFLNNLKIKCAGNGGNIRVLPSNDTDESSIGFYKYTDMRENAAGAMWLIGQNCWAREGFSIGTPGLDSCLNINNVGDVNIPVALSTPVISTDIIVAGIARVSDNIEAVGVIYSSVNVITLTGSRVLTFDNIKNGIITCLNTSSGLTLTLPSGNAIHTGTPTVGFKQSLQWSVINLSSSTGNIIMGSTTGHSYVGNATLTTNASFRFATVLTAANTATTYRICN